MHGGNDVDYPGVISTSCQRSKCAVIGRRGEEQEMHSFGNNAIDSAYCMGFSQAVTDSGHNQATDRIRVKKLLVKSKVLLEDPGEDAEQLWEGL
ncbi:MAG: hypothetical protein GXP57_07560 [Deltaproteobacteria bacterium]|nr:hypothetical protein [Deltaproteobacteria bacterium]